MSLPPGFIDELRTRLSLEQVVGRKVMWDTRKSNTARRDYWAPCPFHQEKSASFHVDDTKGFYYCFGCQAKGDAFSFVQQTENVGFMEAVEILAREAGMPVPARDPRAQEKADERSVLADVMEQAVQHYRLQLRTGAATQARAYLVERGLNEAAQARWEIGFAPDQRRGVTDALVNKGVSLAQIVEAGLAAQPDGGGAPYDRFRGRIVFPIRDARGRAIALGGRAMDPDARAKYLNSPETLLFDKGRSLYNMKPAREACGQGETLIVAEGYMDTIALSEAGFGAVVAPLGTAITEDQLALMWRMHPEPVIALDGDAAGLRAAMRLIDLALPLLEAGRSLRFALMPAGMDPDDLIRARGAAAMRDVLGAALPLVQLLWRRETEGKIFDSPERKAALDKVLRTATQKIADASLRGHYEREIRDLSWALFGKARRQGAPEHKSWNGTWGAKPAPYGQARAVTTGAKSAAIAARGDGAGTGLREAVIFATLIRHPTLVIGVEAHLEALECRDPGHTRLRDAILRHAEAPDLEAALRDALGPEALDALFSMPQIAIAPSLRRGDTEFAEMVVREELAKLNAPLARKTETLEGEEEISSARDERMTYRIRQANEAFERAQRGTHADTSETEVAPNGVTLQREEMDKLDAILASARVAKTRRNPK